MHIKRNDMYAFVYNFNGIHRQYAFSTEWKHKQNENQQNEESSDKRTRMKSNQLQVQVDGRWYVPFQKRDTYF